MKRSGVKQISLLVIDEKINENNGKIKELYQVLLSEPAIRIKKDINLDNYCRKLRKKLKKLKLSHVNLQKAIERAEDSIKAEKVRLEQVRDQIKGVEKDLSKTELFSIEELEYLKKVRDRYIALETQLKEENILQQNERREMVAERDDLSKEIIDVSGKLTKASALYEIQKLEDQNDEWEFQKNQIRDEIERYINLLGYEGKESELNVNSEIMVKFQEDAYMTEKKPLLYYVVYFGSVDLINELLRSGAKFSSLKEDDLRDLSTSISKRFGSDSPILKKILLSPDDETEIEIAHGDKYIEISENPFQKYMTVEETFREKLAKHAEEVIVRGSFDSRDRSGLHNFRDDPDDPKIGMGDDDIGLMSSSPVYHLPEEKGGLDNFSDEEVESFSELDKISGGSLKARRYSFTSTSNISPEEINLSRMTKGATYSEKKKKSYLASDDSMMPNERFKGRE